MKSHPSVYLLVFTAILVIAGCILYVHESVGWAQFFWVMASGTAGACTVLIVEHK